MAKISVLIIITGGMFGYRITDSQFLFHIILIKRMQQLNYLIAICYEEFKSLVKFILKLV